ncbi:MAG: hypothetical protein ABS882_12115 [Lysinibacillus sp.]
MEKFEQIFAFMNEHAEKHEQQGLPYLEGLLETLESSFYGPQKIKL